MTKSIYFPLVELAPGAENNGLAEMIAGLIRQNLEDSPEKMSDFFKLSGRVSIVAEDVEVVLTMEFNRGQLMVHNGIVGIPDVTVRGSSEDIINLSLIEVIPSLGLPDPRGEIFRKVWAATRERRIQVHGALSNLLLMTRLSKVMSVN
ncbi:MAG: hypothetical protein JXA30_13005 [Deltaproteobacteria bacterium]|nr:hypothetical protein [Deltaproteobacteria bacterium]